MTEYTLEDVRRMIREAQAKTKTGTLRSLSVEWAIPYSYISAALHTPRTPSPQILKKLGLKRITKTFYVPEV